MGGLVLTSALFACGGSTSKPEAVKITPGPTVVATTSLLDLQRYHYVASLTLSGAGPDSKPAQVAVSTEGDFQSPDRHAFTYKTQIQGVNVSQSAVVIGDKIWVRQGTAAWQAASPADAQTQTLLATAFSPIRPNFLGGGDWPRVLDAVRRLPSTSEFVNDIRTLHYQVGPEGEQFIRSFLADQQLFQQVQDLHWDLWLAEDGDWPVRLDARGTVTADLQIIHDLGLKTPTTWELRIDISRPNDPKVSVTAPG
jgi:hypothetical protein